MNINSVMTVTMAVMMMVAMVMSAWGGRDMVTRWRALPEREDAGWVEAVTMLGWRVAWSVDAMLVTSVALALMLLVAPHWVPVALPWTLYGVCSVWTLTMFVGLAWTHSRLAALGDEGDDSAYEAVAPLFDRLCLRNVATMAVALGASGVALVEAGLL